jgi:hypothetical protein
MKTFSLVAVLALATASHLVSTAARAQKADTLIKVKSEGAIAAAPAAADTAPKKKGMFGKLKNVAHNKTVQKVTKAALCTAVPGGQYMVAAAEAKKGGKSVASGVANPQSCIPGMPSAGMAGMGGMGGKAGLAGAAMNAASMGGAGGNAGVAGAPNLAQIAAMTGGKGVPGGRGAAVTAVSIATLTSAMEQANVASVANGSGEGGEATTEASGQQIKLSGAVADEIKKGKLVIKKIDWVHGSPSVSAPMTQGFMDLMTTAGQAMSKAGSSYRVDIYMDKKYTEAEIASLGQQRGSIVVASLQAGGQLSPDLVTAGKIGKDKEQRVEIVKVK